MSNDQIELIDDELIDYELIDDENEVVVFQPNIEPRVELTFKQFISGYEEEYDNEDYSDEELKVIYLRGYLNLNFEEIAKDLKISKTSARIVGKEMEKEISNVRLERRIEIRKKNHATQLHIEEAKALATGKAIQALLKRLKTNNELEKLPVEKLIKLISQLGDSLELKGTTFTGRQDDMNFETATDESINEEY